MTTFSSQKSQHNLPCWWFRSKLLWFWKWGLVPFLFHSVSGWCKWKWTQVSSQVTILARKPPRSRSKRRRSSSQVSTRHSLISGVSCRGTHLADTLWNWSTSCTMWCADPWLICKHAAMSFSVTQQFSFTMAWIAAIFCGVTTCAWPGWGASSTEVTPFENFLLHL